VSEKSRHSRGPLALLAALILAAALALAACGDDTVGGGSDEELQTAEGGEATGKLNISNWPGYIDPGKDGTLAEFEEETGIEVDYNEDVNDNNAFFGKVRPLLEQGESGDRDIMVVTDWMAKRMYDLGYLQEFDEATLETAYANLRGPVESTELDPDRSYSMPWQSGMTGIWVNTAEAPDVTSINDLFDPKYRGE
jgi:spermidine/putrescine transport system substrate-binding protein